MRDAEKLSHCCGALPYRINYGPWRCGKCARECALTEPAPPVSLPLPEQEK